MVAAIERVLEDGLVGIEGLPLVGDGVVQPEQHPAAIDLNVVGGNAGEEAGENVPGELTDGDDVGEVGGLSGQLIEGGEFEAWKAAFVDLLIGELVEQDPDNAGMGRVGGAHGGGLRVVEARRRVEIVGLGGEPHHLGEDQNAAEGEEAEDAERTGSHVARVRSRAARRARTMQ